MLRTWFGYIPDVSVFRIQQQKTLFQMSLYPAALYHFQNSTYFGHDVTEWKWRVLLALTPLPRSVQANMENKKGKIKQHFRVSSAVHDHANNELWLALTIIILL